MVISSLYSVRLFRFMRLFNIEMFAFTGATKDTISAVVAWDGQLIDDAYNSRDVQQIAWHLSDQEDIDEGLQLAEYAYDNGHLESDKITLSLRELRARINWDELRFDKAIKALLSIKVDMIDNGKETDYFHIHT